MRGFTLIELMVTVSVLAILGAIAFAGFRLEDVRSQYRRFFDGLEGGLVVAHNAAIDRQTRVRVAIGGDGLTVTAFNPANNTWEFVEMHRIASGQEGLLLDQNACVYGLARGILTPAQAEDDDAGGRPNACLSGDEQILEFQPDGGFRFDEAENMGVTLWVANRKGPAPVLSMIQLFPGGYVRSFRDVREPGS